MKDLCVNLSGYYIKDRAQLLMARRQLCLQFGIWNPLLPQSAIRNVGTR